LPTAPRKVNSPSRAVAIECLVLAYTRLLFVSSHETTDVA